MESVKDIEGNEYKSVKIGGQIWMVENFRTTKFNDGSAIPLVTKHTEWGALSTPAYCFYDNNPENGRKYGALYNWNAAKNQKLAPAGWHVPGYEDWNKLQDYLMANGFNCDGTKTMGNHWDNLIAKSLAAKTDWKTDTHPGTVGNDLKKNNASGFSALPAGLRNKDGHFLDIGGFAGFYTNTGGWTGDAYSFYMNYDFTRFRWEGGHPANGYSVRLVKD
jgi:uncharacterized protein (TIGR02145 family)